MKTIWNSMTIYLFVTYYIKDTVFYAISIMNEIDVNTYKKVLALQ